MGIDYESDLVKHFIRTDGWLPVCRRRLKAIKAQSRRLRYFTFCAVGAVDVLMLDVAKIIKRSSANKFDSVVFFGLDDESIVQTLKSIPGAEGFGANFIDVMLLHDPEESLLEDGDPLDSPEDELDESSVHEKMRLQGIRRKFCRKFPFDVINLDLEEFVFKPKETLPGKMVSALRKVFKWQEQPLIHGRGPGKPLDEFSLMFTTQIGPPDITTECLDELQSNLASNLLQDDRLGPLLIDRSGGDDVTRLKNEQFDLFFTLALPKVIAGILLEKHWYIDPEHGISIYKYNRASRTGGYQMLNLVMDVKCPKFDQRFPKVGDSRSPEAIAAYKEVAFKLFQKPEMQVVEEDLDAAELRTSLELIKSRRRKYYPDEFA